MRKDNNTSVFFNSSISFKLLGALQLNRCSTSHDASLCRCKPGTSLSPCPGEAGNRPKHADLEPNMRENKINKIN